ncbi:hypothetical protein AC1031_004635 [Aphanomyces cochlioides]|nr:hypothetical protein AC1031_004635 [Aphanomyces cochlioides]
MGNSNSHEVAFPLEPLNPMPVVMNDFCYEAPMSLVIPLSTARTKHNCTVQTVDDVVVFLWRGDKTTLMNAERSILMTMERKLHENINTHSVFVDRGERGPSGWLADITVNFLIPSDFEPYLCAQLIFPTTVEGDWADRTAIIYKHVDTRKIAAARIRRWGQINRFGEYVVDVIPGVDVAFIVLLCIAIDVMANVTRGLIL